MRTETDPGARQADRATTADLLRTGPFHDALRAAIEDSGLSLAHLCDRLARAGIKVSPASVSHWQRGRSRPERTDSLRAVRAIETLLGLPAQSLQALLGPPKPRGRWAGRRPSGYGGLLDLAAEIAETADGSIGIDGRSLHTLWQETTVSLGANRAISAVRSRFLVRALASNVDRQVAVYCAEPLATPAKLTTRALENCRVGKLRRHRTSPLSVTELLFDRPLHVDETYLFEFECAGSDTVDVDYRHAFRTRADSFLLSVRFDAAARPTRCYRLLQESPHVELHHDGDLTLSRARSAHVFRHDVGPGVVGIGWDWD
ncbi:helix-turn-helix transcriptional regulator [Actinokineospora sp. NBRC 105648]|uniref:helix-turn-helix domain-containing protein n=1 Tax=Actinokineospora sp. NBRC 105648 TaxID=3032206 RepID=UPI0024A1B59D|nr:helix-turn-helix transcriptional regulator [Actinokineospora sp. NBRC 105648]GLZ39896.1 hypothetical protein Acsp05_35200 [Actinokineospora sp. NBRC 105648]